MKNIYFDNAATTQLDEEVLQEMMPYLKENYGNASSIYKLGRESRKAVEISREKIAKVLNCKPSEIYFTAGGSESDNWALKATAELQNFFHKILQWQIIMAHYMRYNNVTINKCLCKKSTQLNHSQRAKHQLTRSQKIQPLNS